MKHSTTPAFKECHSVGASLCSLHVPTGFGGRAGSEVGVGHIFPWDFLVIITLVEGGADVGETRNRTRCENGLLFYSVAVSALSGVNWCLKFWNRSPETQARTGYMPLDACSPSSGNFDLVENSTGATEAKSGPWCDQGVHWNSPGKLVRVPGSSPSVAFMWELSATAFALSGLNWLCSLYVCTLSLATLVFTIVDSCARTREDGHMVRQAWWVIWSFSLFPGWILMPVIVPPSSLCLLGLWVQTQFLLPNIQQDSVWISPYGFDCRIALLLLSRLICSTSKCIFDVFVGGGWSQGLPTLPSWSFSLLWWLSFLM